MNWEQLAGSDKVRGRVSLGHHTKSEHSLCSFGLPRFDSEADQIDREAHRTRSGSWLA